MEKRTHGDSSIAQRHISGLSPRRWGTDARNDRATICTQTILAAIQIEKKNNKTHCHRLSFQSLLQPADIEHFTIAHIHSHSRKYMYKCYQQRKHIFFGAVHYLRMRSPMEFLYSIWFSICCLFDHFIHALAPKWICRSHFIHINYN